ncbi:MAG: riboflavin biosynthesis protein RibF [Coriobacteriaceae bacterium]|nr:riboflavin biosynthesis protein RibF [Coriobacteriaceae bacterium]
MSAQVVEWEVGCESLGPAVVAIGVFDGVHLGHQTLVRDAVALAWEKGVKSAVLTFDRDPERVLCLDAPPPQLLTLEDKLARLDELAPDIVLVVPFCTRLAEMVPDRFLSDVMTAAFEPVAVMVGEDFRFGRYASGNVESLRHFGGQHGFGVVAHRLVEADGGPVTATRIRGLVAAGDVAAAARLIGRPHRVSGTVVHGRGEGVGLGVPTANVIPHAEAALPAAGVYGGRVITSAGEFKAGISVGRAPTFPKAIDVLEAHLIGFEGDLYGQEITIEFTERLRDQRVFGSAEELSAAMHEDLRYISEA